MKKYKVQLLKDQEYEVLEITTDFEGNEEQESLFQGSISDCEAFIRLKEKDQI